MAKVFIYRDNPNIFISAPERAAERGGCTARSRVRIDFRWRIEIMSWRHSCNRRMREWAAEKGKFIALDDFCDSVAFLEPPEPGRPVAEPRDAVPVDLTRRP